MTSPAGPPEGDVTGDGDAPQQDPSELGEAIRTGRVPIVPGSLVELVMQSGISPGDEEQDDGPPAGPSPAVRPRPSPSPPAPQPPAPSPPAAAPPTAPAAPGAPGAPGAQTPVAPLEDADLGDLGDDPLGVGPVHAGPAGTRAAPTAAADTPPPAPDGAGATADPGPATAPGDVVPPPIAPSPVPVPEPETGPREATPGWDGAGPASEGQLLFGGPRPLPDGPETDVLPGMAFGRVPGRYPSADPVSSTGRTTMPGRRRPPPGPGDTPPPAPRPTMPGPGGSRPPADGDPPLSAPPPAHAPGPLAAAGVDPATGPHRAGARPAGDEPERRDAVSSTATTGVIPAVTDDGPAREPAPADRPGYEADTRTWSPGHAGDGARRDPDAPANGTRSGPRPFRSLQQDPTGTRVVPAVPGTGRPADSRPDGPPTRAPARPAAGRAPARRTRHRPEPGPARGRRPASGPSGARERCGSGDR